MSAIASLESMGLALSLTADGKLALEGLKRLSTEQRKHALTVAREHKPAILKELARRAGINPWEAYWYSVCPDYWQGCESCPDASLYHYDDAGKPIALNSQFCKRHPLPDWARTEAQGRLLQ